MRVFRSVELERIFDSCFLDAHRTRLCGGGNEPVYLPSSDPDREPHRIVYREDYFASALHEVAHWCLAGADRRAIEDYGYWYAEDGRDEEAQLRFESVEARPQALEWIFSEACGFDFHLSADNLASGLGPSVRFESAVQREKTRFAQLGLSSRAARFREALSFFKDCER